MLCATCGQQTVIAIQMRIGGEDVTFHRCSTCESNVWRADDDGRSLADILELARTR